MTTRSAAKTRRVLLVEGNPRNAELVEHVLVSGGHERIVHAASLGDAAKVIASSPVDVVLLGLGLPDVPDSEVVQALQACSPGVPLVVLTGSHDESVAHPCIAAGALDYLVRSELREDTLRWAIGYAVARAKESAERRRTDALQERLFAIMNSSSDAIICSTPDGIVTSWNRGAEAIFGYAEGEALGRPMHDVIRHVEGSAATEGGEHPISESRMRAAVPVAEEHDQLRKDGSKVTLSVVASDLRDADGAVVGITAICRDITEVVAISEELRRRNGELLARDEQMRALAARLNAIREDERTHISREIHDELGQLLTGVKLDLRWVSARLGQGHRLGADPLAARIAEAEKLVDRTVATVQRIALDLRPSALDALGLLAALRDEARRFAARSGIRVDVDVVGTPRPSPDVATELFRILQELLTNVARHAKAHVARVVLEETDEAWSLSVEDDGVGMRDKLGRPGSLGLLGIKERARALGGEATWRQGRERGTLASVRIPQADVGSKKAG